MDEVIRDTLAAELRREGVVLPMQWFNALASALVAVAEKEKAAAVKAEREACAQLAAHGENAAAAIRARGEGET